MNLRSTFVASRNASAAANAIISRVQFAASNIEANRTNSILNVKWFTDSQVASYFNNWCPIRHHCNTTKGNSANAVYPSRQGFSVTNSTRMFVDINFILLKNRNDIRIANSIRRKPSSLGSQQLRLKTTSRKCDDLRSENPPESVATVEIDKTKSTSSMKRPGGKLPSLEEDNLRESTSRRRNRSIANMSRLERDKDMYEQIRQVSFRQKEQARIRTATNVYRALCGNLVICVGTNLLSTRFVSGKTSSLNLRI